MVDRARKLRQPLTPPEALLWSRLRNRQLGEFKFRRQYPIGNFIVDFCCFEIKLVVELDGESHAFQAEYDRKRTAELRAQGFYEIRFWNRDMIANIDSVLEQIFQECVRRQGELKPSP
jgi:very-short-patch-repair endonuclease